MVMKRKRDDLEDDETVRDVVPDGGVVRVPLLLTDSAARAHQPHYVTPTDAEARAARREATAAYDEMCKRATEAWRTPVSVTPVIKDAAEPDAGAERRHLEPAAAQQRRDRAWKDYCARLSTAWQ